MGVALLTIRKLLYGQCYVDGRASDPRELGWMRGAPPAAEKRIRLEGDTFFNFPQMRWSLSHIARACGDRQGVARAEQLTPFDQSDKAPTSTHSPSDNDGRTRRFDEATATPTALWCCIAGASCTTSARSNRTCLMRRRSYTICPSYGARHSMTLRCAEQWRCRPIWRTRLCRRALQDQGWLMTSPGNVWSSCRYLVHCVTRGA